MDWNWNIATVKVTCYLTMLFHPNLNLIFFDCQQPFIKVFRGFFFSSFFTKEMKLDYYHHKLTAQVASQKFDLGNYRFKVNNRNTRTRYEICLKLTIKTPEQRHWTYPTPCSIVSFVNFEHVDTSWVSRKPLKCLKSKASS